jgi:hypothetical protein
VLGVGHGELLLNDSIQELSPQCMGKAGVLSSLSWCAILAPSAEVRGTQASVFSADLCPKWSLHAMSGGWME